MGFVGIDSLAWMSKAGDRVSNVECALSFAVPDDKNGLLICLLTVVGFGSDVVDEYLRRTGNAVSLQY